MSALEVPSLCFFRCLTRLTQKMMSEYIQTHEMHNVDCTAFAQTSWMISSHLMRGIIIFTDSFRLNSGITFISQTAVYMSDYLALPYLTSHSCHRRQESLDCTHCRLQSPSARLSLLNSQTYTANLFRMDI